MNNLFIIVKMEKKKNEKEEIPTLPSHRKGLVQVSLLKTPLFSIDCDLKMQEMAS